jgi:hypothetical protein
LNCFFFVFFGTIQIGQSHPAGALRYSGAPNSPLDRCLFSRRAGLRASPLPLAASLQQLFSPKLFYWQIKSSMPCIMLCIMLRSQLASAAPALLPGVLQSPGRHTFPSTLTAGTLSRHNQRLNLLFQDEKHSLEALFRAFRIFRAFVIQSFRRP